MCSGLTSDVLQSTMSDRLLCQCQRFYTPGGETSRERFYYNVKQHLLLAREMFRPTDLDWSFLEDAESRLLYGMQDFMTSSSLAKTCVKPRLELETELGPLLPESHDVICSDDYLTPPVTLVFLATARPSSGWPSCFMLIPFQVMETGTIRLESMWLLSDTHTPTLRQNSSGEVTAVMERELGDVLNIQRF